MVSHTHRPSKILWLVAYVIIGLLSNTVSAWFQINFLTDRENWFDDRPETSGRRTSFKDASECHATANKRHPISIDATAIWNRFDFDGDPNIRAFGFYGDYLCGVSGGPVAPSGRRKIPFMITVLDPKKMNGINVINFRALGLNPTYGSWKPIDVDQERKKGGFLGSIPESDLKDAVLIFRDEKSPAGQQGWQPITGGITHVNPGAWTFIRDNIDVQFYLKEITERILQPQWSNSQRIVDATVNLGHKMTKKVLQVHRIEWREEGRSFLRKPFLSIEEAAPAEVHPAVMLPERSPKFYPVVSIRKQKQPTSIPKKRRKAGSQPPKSPERNRVSKLRATLSLEKPNVRQTSASHLIVELIPSKSLEEIQNQQIPEQEILNQFENSPDKTSWFHALKAQWKYLDSIYEFSINLYNQDRNSGNQGNTEVFEGQEEGQTNNAIKLSGAHTELIEGERELAIENENSKGDEQFEDFTSSLQQATEGSAFGDVPISGGSDSDIFNSRVEKALPLRFESARKFYLGRSDENIINRWRNTLKRPAPYPNLPIPRRPIEPQAVYQPANTGGLFDEKDIKFDDSKDFEEIEAEFNSHRYSRGPRQSLPL
ncbi:hypothetical protein TWF694_001472 [Orbilia ellipsospora]|uniref:Uncharacterized protein n=1 Tax=Orbilia ellipsospora TaxID=2528407 RepID=A0AAV9XS33_9PEZI